MAKTHAVVPLKKGERVVATRTLRGVPEGMRGTIKVANGLTWDRYWVQWENGLWLGSVSNADLVRESDWGEFKRRRSEEASRSEVETKQQPLATSGEATAAGGAGGKVPAHLLERSAAARARVSGG